MNHIKLFHLILKLCSYLGNVHKNACLECVQHVALSPPNATFTATTKTCTDCASVKEAFLKQELSEQELKLGLIEELNNS